MTVGKEFAPISTNFRAPEIKVIPYLEEYSYNNDSFVIIRYKQREESFIIEVYISAI